MTNKKRKQAKGSKCKERQQKGHRAARATATAKSSKNKEQV
jgi:hypothetical protein